MIHLTLLEVCCVGAVLFLTSHVWFFVRVLWPLHRFSLQVQGLTIGNLDAFEEDCGGILELQKLRRAMAGMVRHVRRAQDQQRAYTEQLTTGQETERKRLARELHDDTIQSIIAVTQGIEMARGWVETDPGRASQMMQLAREQAVDVVIHLRNLIGGLRPPALEELGLVPALRMQLDAVTTVTTNFAVVGESRRLSENHELALFRAAQEALHNTIRHSQATHIDMALRYESDSVRLQIRDNGQGFRPPASLGEFAADHHYGLLGIEERITQLNGQFRIDSQPGEGTTLSIAVPVKPQPQPVNVVRDPVCSAVIEPKRAYGSLSFQGETYYFCCPVCQGAFQNDPETYLPTSTAAGGTANTP